MLFCFTGDREEEQPRVCRITMTALIQPGYTTRRLDATLPRLYLIRFDIDIGLLSSEMTTSIEHRRCWLGAGNTWGGSAST